MYTKEFTLILSILCAGEKGTLFWMDTAALKFFASIEMFLFLAGINGCVTHKFGISLFPVCKRQFRINKTVSSAAS